MRMKIENRKKYVVFTFSTSKIIDPFSVLSPMYRMKDICCSHFWILLEASYSKFINLLCLNPASIPKPKQTNKNLLLTRCLVRTLTASC